MLEVFQNGNGWSWRWICAKGRTLVECLEVHPCDLTAFDAARNYRISFWRVADATDHRQGRCI